MDGGCRSVRGGGLWELTGGWWKVTVDIRR